MSDISKQRHVALTGIVWRWWSDPLNITFMPHNWFCITVLRTEDPTGIVHIAYLP